MIEPGKHEVENPAADAVSNIQVASTVTELMSLLGLCNLFKPFVLKFSRTTSPLSKLLRQLQSKELVPLTAEEL